MLRTLDWLIREVSVNPEPATVFPKLLSGLDRIFGPRAPGMILLVGPDEGGLTLVDVAFIDPGQAELGTVLRFDELDLPEPDRLIDPIRSAKPMFGLEPDRDNLWIAPIRSAKVFIGIIVVSIRRVMSPERRFFLAAAGHLLGMAIEHAGLVDRMSQDLDRINQFQEQLKVKNEELKVQVRAAQEASRLKSQFLANVSHEIRTPMNGILGMAELVLGTDLDPRQRQYLTVLQTSAEALLDLINDLLDIARIEADRMELDKAAFDLRATVEQVIGAMAVRAREKGLRLSYLLPAGTPVALVGDSARLRQVLINLLDNAVKFTAAGEISLTVAAVSVDDDQALLRFSVRDSGPGIKPEDRDRIFQPFTQSEDSPSTTRGGAGLGLAISRQLVELMGGELTLESRPDEGSVFTFTARLGLDRQVTPPDRGRVDLTGWPVLVVEDNPTDRLVMTEILSNWGAEVSEAADGQSGLVALNRAAAEGRPPKLVVIDRNMPRLDGMEMIRRMRDDDLIPEAVVILATTTPQPGDAGLWRELGVAANLEKPVKMTALRQAIEQAAGEEMEYKHSSGAPDETVMIADRQGVRVLLVEDNLVNRMVVEEMLRRLDWQVVSVVNGREALEALKIGVFDVVLMDVRMPEMDGLQATRLIRRNPALSGLPIIGLTAHAMKGDREACLAAGMDDYLPKPVQASDLIAAINRSLSPAVNGVSSSARPVDLAKALGLIDNDETLLNKLIDTFLFDIDAQLADLTAALAQADGEAAARALYRLKGGAVQLAAGPLNAKIERVAALVDHGRLGQALDRMTQLEEAAQDVKDFFGQWRRRGGR